MKQWRGILVILISIASLLLVLLLLEIRFYKAEIQRLSTSVSMVDKEIDRKMFGSVEYLERRINRLAQTQDEYQIGMSRKMDILEKKLDRLEKRQRNNYNNE